MKPTRQNREIEGTLRELRQAYSDGLKVGALVSTSAIGMALGFLWSLGFVVIP